MKNMRLILLAIAVFITSNCFADSQTDVLQSFPRYRMSGMTAEEKRLSDEIHCKRGDGVACENLGLAASGKNKESFFKQACDLNNSRACVRLGNLYKEGNEVRQSDSYAKEYFSRACSLNNGEGCFEMGQCSSFGWIKKKYYGKACDLGYRNGCLLYKYQSIFP